MWSVEFIEKYSNNELYSGQRGLCSAVGYHIWYIIMIIYFIQALTDDEARRNWEKYGNPDGPGAMSFGIALPSWIVEKENSVWVLGLYALVFMVALPTAVSILLVLLLLL